MSLSKQLVDESPASGAQRRVEPSGADSAPFVYVEFRHRSQVLRVAVLCPTCFQKPEWTMDLEQERQKYNVYSHPYLDGDRECYDCGKLPGQGA